MLNKAVDAASARAGWAPTIYMTNIVGCRPFDGGDSENRDPSPAEAAACRPRLHETIAAVLPQRIVALGTYVRGELLLACPDAVHLQHPAYLAREGADSPAFRRFVAGLADVFAGLRDERSRSC
jgi:uracil-DNA glycosylase family 4